MLPLIWLLVLDVRSDHITPVLRQLLTAGTPAHRLQGCKVATLVHRSPSGISPSYLSDLVADAREQQLHSRASRSCIVTRTYSTFGDRSLAAAAPGLWNSLPSHVKEADLSYNRFRQLLKRHFYPRDAMLARVIAIATCLSVRLSVCPSRAGIVSKRRMLAA